MKKVLYVMIMILLLPMFVYAEDNNLVLKSITLEKLSEDVEELSLATIENNKINLDLKMYEVGDTAEYIVVVENTSDKDLYIEKNLVSTESTYFDYELLGVDKSTVIEKNSEKEFVLKVKYHNEVQKENFFSAKFKDISSLSFLFSNSSNPETKRNIILFLVVIVTIFLALKYSKKNKLILLLLLLGIVPFTTTAENNYNVKINSNILIKKVKPNPCTFDGELVQGAEYTNGQYTYRYMQEGKNTTEWKNINNDGWGVVLTDKDSLEDVTTKLCTSINDKPIVSMSYMFHRSKTKNVDLSSFDTSNVVSMGYMFSEMPSLTALDFSSFDTSNVTDMNTMFAGNLSLKSIDLHYFDTSNVTNLYQFFADGTSLKKIDLSSFDTSNVTNMCAMFVNNASLKSVDLSNFNTSKVTNMQAMFAGASSLEEINIDNFDLTGSTNGSGIIGGMFSGATNLKKISMKNWKIPENFTYAIGCNTSNLCSQNLEYIDVTDWDLTAITNLYGLFVNLPAKEIKGLETWDTSNVTNMCAMFVNNASLKSLDLSSFDTSNVTNMSWMFSNNSNLEVIIVGDSFQTEQVEQSSYMFSNDIKLIGGEGTLYNENYQDKTYARIDAPGTPGYFTGVS